MKLALKENIEELISLLFAFLLSIGYCHAQWTELDSLKLKGLLEKEGEIELNPDALRSIVGLHHFTNENTICLCRKRIYELMVELSSTTMSTDVINSAGILAIHFL